MKDQNAELLAILKNPMSAHGIHDERHSHVHARPSDDANHENWGQYRANAKNSWFEHFFSSKSNAGRRKQSDLF